MNIKSYAVNAPHGKLSLFDYPAKELGPFDVKVQITHCGICHSDIHLIDNDWGRSVYPLVPGHEIVGIVTGKGSLVNHLSIDERVGIGWQRSACLECDVCLNGDENYCRNTQATCVGHHGGFAEFIHADSRFVFPIPDGLQSENAAPLLCGGVTVFSPLKHFGVKPTMRVGVIGIGGLGHLALQFAKAFGCEVVAFSHSAAKEAEARSFGADYFASSIDPAALEDFGSALDFVISAGYADLEWEAFLETLRPNGKLCIVGVPQEPLSIPALPLIAGRRMVCGSAIGGRSDMRQMLEFAARHDIKAKTELEPFERINEAVEKVRSGKARYRVVLEIG